MSSENLWYLIVDSAEGRCQEGPVSGEELQRMLSDGTISTDTLVWREGMTDWVPIGTPPDFSLPSLKDSPTPTPDAESSGAEDSPLSQEAYEPDRPSDAVTIKETGSHTVQFIKSRNVLLITTNEYHAGPLVLTRLDLLNFLTAMEALQPGN